MSALGCYKLDGFSVERLMLFLTALDQDVDRHPRQAALAPPWAHLGRGRVEPLQPTSSGGGPRR